MNKEEIMSFLRANKTYMEENFGVKSIALFGSYAKGSEKEDSDIDIFVELKAPEFSWWAGLKIFLEKNFKKDVDVVRKGEHLRERFLKTIEAESIHV